MDREPVVDKIGQEIVPGHIVVYVTSGSGNLNFARVLDVEQVKNRYNDSFSWRVKVKGRRNLQAGWTYPERTLVINPDNLPKEIVDEL